MTSQLPCTEVELIARLPRFDNFITFILWFFYFLFFQHECALFSKETVTVGVDASVLDRIAKIMTYLRLGSSGKVLKKKKKEKDSKGLVFMICPIKKI